MLYVYGWFYDPELLAEAQEDSWFTLAMYLKILRGFHLYKI